MRGGTYSYGSQITIDRTNNGTASAIKQIIPYAAEKPILDFSSQSYNIADVSLNARGFQVNGSYWTIKGLEIKGSADNGVYVSGNNNRLENLDVHHNGIQECSLVDMPQRLCAASGLQTITSKHVLP